MSFTPSHMLKRDDCVLVVIDIQDKLLPQINEGDKVISQSAKLIQGARALGVPIVWTEQYKKGLGETNSAIREAIADCTTPREKTSFGCLSDEGIKKEVDGIGRGTLILCGIEAHICVMQTALHALDEGKRVVLAEDAISSRNPRDRQAGIARMYHEGVVPATVESLLMEWTGRAGTDEFKKILPIIK